jgi:hypothetical protein
MALRSRDFFLKNESSPEANRRREFNRRVRAVINDFKVLELVFQDGGRLSSLLK